MGPGTYMLLFLTPASLDAAPGNYSITLGTAYKLAGGTYAYNGELVDQLPPTMPADSAEQQSVS
jgi:hypothetical protein